MCVCCQTSCSDQEIDDDPDGVYAFRRQPGVDYLAVCLEMLLVGIVHVAYQK